MIPDGPLNAVTLAPDKNGVVINVEPYPDRVMDLVENRINQIIVDKIVIRFFTDPKKVYHAVNTFVIIPGKLWACAVVEGK